MNQKTIERVPTCGENDVDLRIARSPRRAVDRPASAAPQPVDAAQAVPSVKQLVAQLHDGQTFWLPKSAHRREEMAKAFEAIANVFRTAPTESGLD